jgi:hypothetical protein
VGVGIGIRNAHRQPVDRTHGQVGFHAADLGGAKRVDGFQRVPDGAVLLQDEVVEVDLRVVRSMM